jgi:hypothetical protein
VPAEQIATNLALINWTLLTGLAVGSFAVVVLARLATPATKGYLAFGRLRGRLGCSPTCRIPGCRRRRGPVPIDPAFDAPRRLALVVFVVLAVLTTIALARGAAR